MAASEVPLGGNPPLRPYLIAHAVAVSAMIAGLLIEGRVLFCGCGSWVPWVLDVNSQHCSQHMFDAYTASHVLHGVVFFGAFWLLRRKISGAWRWWAGGHRFRGEECGTVWPTLRLGLGTCGPVIVRPIGMSVVPSFLTHTRRSSLPQGLLILIVVA